MRLAYVCADRGISLPGDAGGSVHFAALTGALARAGHEVDVYCVKGEGDLAGARRTIRLRPPAAASDLRRRLDGGPRAQAGKELWSLFLNPTLTRELRAHHRRAPYDAVLERLSVWSFALPALCRELGVPHLLEVNARVVWEQKRHFAIALEDGAEAVQDYLLRSTDAVLAVSAELARQCAEVTGAPVRVLPNGVDTGLFHPDRRLDPAPAWATEGRFLAAFVGTLKPFHDLAALAAAAARLPEDCLVVVVGEGPGYAELAGSEAAARGQLRAVGLLPHDVVADLLGLCDAGLATTAPGYRYLSPLKLPEYLASGLPVVVGRGSQGDDLLDAGVKEVYEPGDAKSLAAAIMRLKDRGGRAALGAAARAAGEARSWSACAEAVVEAVEAIRQSRVSSSATRASSRSAAQSS